MIDAAAQPWTDEERKAIEDGLRRVLKSTPFQQSKRRQRFLEFVISETLAGRGGELKGYVVGVEVFDKPSSFDPLVDPVVRVEAARLRDKLREYYESEGAGDPVRIDLPKGGYVPLIEFRQPPAVPPASAPVVAPTSTGPRQFRFNLDAIRGTAIAAVLLLLLGGLYAWRQTTDEAPRSEKASIAVLPFAAIGADPVWKRFADGLTEDIVTDLAQSKDLFVVARHSTEAYRGTTPDIRTIGRELGVSYLLEGSIQPSDTRIKVTAQLIDARSGTNIWSHRYSRPSVDLFDVQRDVTEKIAATLTGYQGALAQAERALIRRKPPGSLTAYEHYLLGMEAKHGGASGAVTKEGLEEAERHFLRALQIDPQLARAYVGLAYIYEYRLEFGLGGTPAENLGGLEKVARKAVQLDPNDAEAQLIVGHSLAYRGLAEQAIEQFNRAEALAPSNADVAILIAWYLPQLDQPERAAQLADRALQLNPNYPAWYNQGLRYAYFFNRQFDKALKYTKLVTAPTATDHAYLAAASAMLGDTETARSAARDAAGADPNWSVEKYLSDNGGFPDALAAIFVDSAAKAGVRACVPADMLPTVPGLKRLKACDERRAEASPG